MTSRMRRAIVTLACAVVLLAAPASAAADTPAAVARYFDRTATIPNCRFSAATLLAAQSAQQTYDLQYDAAFPAAIQSALQAQISGACAVGNSGRVPLPGVAGLSGGGAGRLPGSATDATASGVPLAILLMAALALLVGAGTALYALLRRDGIESLAAADWRHSCAEAGVRMMDRWAALTMRRGR